MSKWLSSFLQPAHRTGISGTFSEKIPVLEKSGNFRSPKVTEHLVIFHTVVRCCGKHKSIVQIFTDLSFFGSAEQHPSADQNAMDEFFKPEVISVATYMDSPMKQCRLASVSGVDEVNNLSSNVTINWQVISAAFQTSQGVADIHGLALAVQTASKPKTQFLSSTIAENVQISTIWFVSTNQLHQNCDRKVLERSGGTWPFLYPKRRIIMRSVPRKYNLKKKQKKNWKLPTSFPASFIWFSYFQWLTKFPYLHTHVSPQKGNMKAGKAFHVWSQQDSHHCKILEQLAWLLLASI